MLRIAHTVKTVRGRRPPDLPLPFHQHLLAKLKPCREDTCSPGICLSESERSSPSLELQLTRSDQAEFVICDHTIELESQDWFIQGRKWHAGVEGRISVLTRAHGLGRCLDHGSSGFERWVEWGIITANLAVMGRA